MISLKKFLDDLAGENHTFTEGNGLIPVEADFEIETSSGTSSEEPEEPKEEKQLPIRFSKLIQN